MGMVEGVAISRSRRSEDPAVTAACEQHGQETTH
jgi:hypothetical protein